MFLISKNQHSPGLLHFSRVSFQTFMVFLFVQKKKVDEKTNVTIKAGKDAKEEKEKDDKEDCPDKKSAKCKK